VSLLVGIALALVLGVILGMVLARLRHRRRPASAPPNDVASLLRAYRHGHYDRVVEAAPRVAADLGEVAGASWGSRLELVWGHSLFQLDRYEEAIPHLRRGLDESPAPQEAETRFRHCLGYALQRTGDRVGARAVYEDLLRDADLDPSVRDGVERNLAELDRATEG
jgi:tetratricopeptide (TPR) repeat protein